jgi:Cdc6-like AAA superfamily ATPase
MSKKIFTEIINPNIPTKLTPIKEKMDIYIPDVPEGLSRRNGMVYCLVGSGGSGKTSLLLNMFKSKKCIVQSFIQYIIYVLPQVLAVLKSTPLVVMIKYTTN